MLTRRIIGPTIITLVIFGLWLDYLLLPESPWSATRILGKILAIFGRIFSPFVNPANFAWANEFLVPASIIFCVLILLYAIVAGAKSAMKKATVDAEEFVVLPAPKPSPVAQPEFREVSAVSKARPTWSRFGYRQKVTTSFAAVSLMFGLSVSIVVYGGLEGVLEKEIKRRAEIFALSLGEIAGRKSSLAPQSPLNDAIEKLASSTLVAYLYVEDAAGRIVANEPRDLPLYLSRDFPKSSERALKGVEMDYRGAPVYEITVRVGGVQGGYAHLAIWRDAIAEETRGAVSTMAGWVLISMTVVTLLFAWVVRILCRPLIELVQVASRISKGYLDLEIDNVGTDEVGDLARSFDSMRSKLQAVLSQLEESPAPERPKENVG